MIEYYPGKANVVADTLSQKIVKCSAGIISYDVGNLVALWEINTVLKTK